MIAVTDCFGKIQVFRERVLPILASDTRRRLASGAFWGGVGGGVVRVLLLMTSLFLARVLGREKFGEYGMVTSTTALFCAFGGLGVGSAITRYVALLRKTDRERAGRILSLSVFMTCVSGILTGGCFALLAPILAQNVLAAPHLTGALRIAAMSMALGIVNGAQQAALAGFEAFKTSAWIGGIGGIFQAVAVCVGAYCWDVNGAVAGLAASILFSAIVSHFSIYRHMKNEGVPSRWRGMWTEWRVLVGFSLPAFLTMVIASPVDWGCNAFLANQPNGYTELGLLNAAGQWRAAVAFLPWLLCTAAMPVMSERYGNTGDGGTLQLMFRLMGVMVAVVVPVTIVMCLAGDFILRGYGASFVGGLWVLVLTLVTAAIQSIIVPCWYFFFSSNRVWACFFMNGGLGILSIGLTWLMIQYGALGVSSARCLAMTVHAGWILLYAFHIAQNESIPKERRLS